MFAKIKIKIKQKPYLLLIPLLIALVIMLIPDIASAADLGNKAELEKYLKEANNKISTAMKFCTMLLWPILMMIGGLMDSSIIFGGGMEDRLLMVWTTIRNFVNIIFVLILLVIAFYNVLGISDEGGDYALKKALPKFVIALIGINFSFMIIRTVVDVTNVLTAAVATLPAEIVDIDLKKETLEKICSNVDSTTNLPKNQRLCSSKDKLTELAESFFKITDKKTGGQVNEVNVGFVMAMINIGQFEYVEGTAPKELMSFVIYMANTLLIMIIYFISYIVLFLVLLFRVVVIWVITAVSPLIGLIYMLPQNIKGEVTGESDLTKTFVQHAIAPVIIAAAMSIGFIMNYALKGATFPSIMTGSLADIAPDLKIGDLSNLHELVIVISGAVIVWVGVFGAASKTIAHHVTDSIKGMAEGAAKFIGGSLQYLPIAPIDVTSDGTVNTDELFSVASLSRGLKMIPQALEEHSAKQASRIWRGDADPGAPYVDLMKTANASNNLPKFAYAHKAFQENGGSLEDRGYQSALATALNNNKEDTAIKALISSHPGLINDLSKNNLSEAQMMKIMEGLTGDQKRVLFGSSSFNFTEAYMKGDKARDENKKSKSQKDESEQHGKDLAAAATPAAIMSMALNDDKMRTSTMYENALVKVDAELESVKKDIEKNPTDANLKTKQTNLEKKKKALGQLAGGDGTFSKIQNEVKALKDRGINIAENDLVMSPDGEINLSETLSQLQSYSEVADIRDAIKDKNPTEADNIIKNRLANPGGSTPDRIKKTLNDAITTGQISKAAGTGDANKFEQSQVPDSMKVELDITAKAVDYENTAQDDPIREQNKQTMQKGIQAAITNGKINDQIISTLPSSTRPAAIEAVNELKFTQDPVPDIKLIPLGGASTNHPQQVNQVLSDRIKVGTPEEIKQKKLEVITKALADGTRVPAGEPLNIALTALQTELTK